GDRGEGVGLDERAAHEDRGARVRLRGVEVDPRVVGSREGQLPLRRPVVEYEAPRLRVEAEEHAPPLVQRLRAGLRARLPELRVRGRRLVREEGRGTAYEDRAEEREERDDQQDLDQRES